MSARHEEAIPLRARQQMLLQLAVQLSRETNGRHRTLSELADDALALAQAGDDARSAIEEGRDASPAFHRARCVASVYGALTVEHDSVSGIVLGLRFMSGAYCRAGTIFAVSWGAGVNVETLAAGPSYLRAGYESPARLNPSKDWL
jgi:hypothetical protein